MITLDLDFITRCAGRIGTLDHKKMKKSVEENYRTSHIREMTKQVSGNRMKKKQQTNNQLLVEIVKGAFVLLGIYLTWHLASGPK